jgi:hypothetical protein
MIKNMCKNIVFSLVFALVFAISLRTFAQTTDSGTYVVYVGDQAAADEIYASEKLSDGSVRTVSKVGATTYITTTKNDKPIEYYGKQCLEQFHQFAGAI